ncbi:hypothetical protein scyTo_0001555 [Scyliorhinus torazame]|uniref:Uncharacterized protein n=1 Tax=Scyliorhinus torazame TaxID=75743 RepID=A0A401PE55_SCYTO|nr:hypothetical protein [Scyliorhinus torazame]
MSCTLHDLKLRVRILIDGTLIIFRVKPEDSGKYTCVPSNSLGRSPSASSYLTVQYPARVVNMPPTIYLPVGMPGYIKCPVDADPPVTQVKWTKDGRPLKIEKFRGWNLLNDGTITLEEATEEALGTYTCVPYNSLGTMGQSTPARLVLKDPPYFTVLPGWEYRQEVGRELVIPCAAAGDPFPVISWRKVGKPSKSKHNILPSGSLQFKALSKEDHGQWECVATNVVTSITASTHLTVIGTSPHAPTNIRVTATMTSANASWDPGYDGGYEQTFTVWVKRAMLGPHDWLSLPVSAGLTWLLVEGLEPETAYQFSVLAQNKLGTGPFSEVITVNTLAFPVTTREPLVLLSPPRCLTANRTHQGVLLSWLSPANHSYPIDHYIMEFRLGDRWEILDDAIPGTETDLLTKELSLDSWYEFRVMAVMQDLISEPSNIVGVSSSDIFPPPEVPEEGLARPVVAGIVATICFLAAAILFSTLAACFVNRQRKRKNKRKRDPPLSITHCRKSVESPSSSGKVSPESIRTLRAPSDSSEDAQAIHAKMMSPGREREMSLYKKTKRAITSRKYSVSKHEAEADVTTPIELISRGPDGRFIMDPSEMETALKTRRIEGFPFAEETDTYPEFRQSDEENNETLTPTAIMSLKSQLSPLSSSQESYLQPPAYSPSFQKTGISMGGLDSRLQATASSRLGMECKSRVSSQTQHCSRRLPLFKVGLKLVLPQHSAFPAEGQGWQTASRRPPDTHGAAAVPESFEVLRYPRVRKPKQATHLTSKTQRKNSQGHIACKHQVVLQTFGDATKFRGQHRYKAGFPISQVQQPGESQVLQSQGILYLQKKKRHSRQDPYAYFSAMKDEFHKYRQQPEDEMAILDQVDHEEHHGQATQL